MFESPLSLPIQESSPIAANDEFFTGAPGAGRIVNGAEVWLLEDDKNLKSRQNESQQGLTICCYKIQSNAPSLFREEFIAKDDAAVAHSSVNAALKLLCEAVTQSDNALIVTGTSYGDSPLFIQSIGKMEVNFIVKMKPTTRVEIDGEAHQLRELMIGLTWQDMTLAHGRFKTEFHCAVSTLDGVRVAGVAGRLVIAQIGGVSDDLFRSTYFGFSNALDWNDKSLLQALFWTKWAGEAIRQKRRQGRASASLHRNRAAVGATLTLPLELEELPRHNLKRPGNAHLAAALPIEARPWTARRALPARVNLVELFAGAGGMALGFLGAQAPNKELELLFSGEISPVYAQTLRANHRHWNQIHGRATLPSHVEAVDLASERSFGVIADATAGKAVSIVVGGPPCQGFSAANRNSWSSENPNNALVEVFFRHVEAMRPRVFLMENVQGILWTSGQGSRLSVADELQARLEKAGYDTFPHLLDAAWFGVPQHRLRYFLLGVHREMGYTRADFGEYGPFPSPTHGPNADVPFVTVRDALADLPPIENGQARDEMSYREPAELNEFLAQMRAHAAPGEITDHVTSRHAAYVLERYRQIPPGGNWQSIQHLMTNYADIKRTHSNIYRRLEWDKPSITMGHYRKSMLIHPNQDRGLSLREAMRLQSFPDWYRFAGNAQDQAGGLMHKQQQLANAVCPLLLKAIATEILKL